MGRRGRGEGCIYQRKRDGCWLAIVDVGCRADGKRQRKYLYAGTKAEVLEKLRQFHSEGLAGVSAEPAKVTVAAFLARWLEEVARPSIRATTHLRYEITIRRHINPHIGGVLLSKLSPLHVQSMIATIQRDGSPRNSQHAYQVLHRALGQAAKWGMVPRNVCAVVDKPKAPKRTMQVWTPEQVAQFLAAARGDRLGPLYFLALTTGMRQGELFGLQWQDVDLAGRTLSIQHTLLEISGRHELAEPKTAKGRRRVDLPAVAVRALSEHRERMAAEGHGEVAWVFCDTDGKPLRKSNVMRRSFNPLVEAAGVPLIRFHDLRHTAATLLLAQGVHPKVVQERLGHAQIAMTLDTYSHVLPSMQRDAADRLDALFLA
jgi:integrase